MKSRLIQGLFWREWLLHQGELRWAFAAWLFGVWVFPIPPMFFLLPFGVIAALLLAPSFGGADAQEESEEFSFALPPTRSQRYLVRLALGGGALLAMMVVGLLAGLFDLPQRVWGLLFESDLTTPFRQPKLLTVYALVLAFPAAVFGECFAAGASSRNPQGMNYLWIRGLFVAGVIAAGTSIAEQAVWHNVTGTIMAIVLTLWGGVRLAWSYRDYVWKEGVSGLPRLTVVTGSKSKTWVVLFVILVLVVFLAAIFLVAGSRPEAPVRGY